MTHLRIHLLIIALTATTLAACKGGPDPVDMDAEELVVSGCSADDECPGGRCVAGIGSGLCTANCSDQGDCPDGTICADTEGSRGVCLLTCTKGQECTEHLGPAYTCDTETNLDNGRDARVCIDGR
jgi:hypothetical protein